MVGNSQSVSTTFERRAKRSPLARALTPAESDVVTATSSASALTRPANAARADSCRSTQYSHGAPYSSQSARYCSYDARTASERAPCEQELMYTRCSKIGKRFRQRAGTSVMASVVTFPILGADCGRIVTLPRHRGSDPALSDAARALDEASHFRDTEGQTLPFRTRPALWTKRHTSATPRVRPCPFGRGPRCGRSVTLPRDRGPDPAVSGRGPRWGRRAPQPGACPQLSGQPPRPA